MSSWARLMPLISTISIESNRDMEHYIGATRQILKSKRGT